MSMNKYFENSIIYDMLFAHDTCESKICILSGEHQDVENHTFIKSNNKDVNFKNLEKMNYMAHERYASEIKKIFYNLNEKSKESNIKFAANAKFKTSYVQISNLNNTEEDYRKDGTIRITLKNNNNMVYTDIPFLDNINEMIGRINKEYNILINELDANFTEFIDLKSGKYDIVFSSKAGAYLIHEIIGHMLEADHIFSNSSIFSGYKIGDRILKNSLSIYDDPTILKDYNIGVGKYDDDGKLVKPINLILNGLLNEYIANDKYSEQMEYNMTAGCSRSQSYKHNAIPRMRNTFLYNNEKNSINYDYIQKNVDNGLFIDNVFSGMANPLDGNFLLSCGRGIYVSHGRNLGKTHNIIISDNIFNVLKNIDVVGNDLKFYVGKCVKAGQIVTVGMGSPSIKVNNLQVIIGGMQ